MEAKKNPAAQAMEDKLKNNKVLRDARREMGKFALDCTKITISIRRGTLSVFGKLAPLNGQEAVFDDERKALVKALKNLPEVHTVVFQ
jgi:hypothetical protein